LWKYLGSKEVGEGPDVKMVPIQAGDKFVLCSDGMSGSVLDPQILAFVNEHPDVQACADGLGQLALDNGSRDNVSVIVIEVVEGR
jgi:serine/threonine protein phosphatase PrpC